MNDTILFILLAIGLLVIVVLIVFLSIHKSIESIKDMTRATYGTDSIEEALAQDDQWPNEAQDTLKVEEPLAKSTTNPPIISEKNL